MPLKTAATNLRYEQLEMAAVSRRVPTGNGASNSSYFTQVHSLETTKQYQHLHRHNVRFRIMQNRLS